MSPVTDYHEVQAGDIVCVKWHGWYMTHLVQEIQGEQFLIANSLGKINGWVPGSDILGRVTKIVEPEPRPSVEEMLELLENSYRKLINQRQATTIEAEKLLSIAADMRWYAERLGPERWLRQPKLNKWSFEQDLWYLAKRARDAATETQVKPITYWIDQGKQCVGLVAEVLFLFEHNESIFD
jgi:hypothetical protein